MRRDRELSGYAGKYLDAFVARFDADRAQAPWVRAAQDHAARAARLPEGLEAQGMHVATFVLKTQSRLLVGSGYKNALEVGMTFHHPGGFPYLPGSSIKGVCRAWAEEVLGEAEVPKDHLKRVFGSRSKRIDDHAPEGEGSFVRGAVRFYDALPAHGFPKLEVDLLNPHVPGYYRSGEAPASWQDPTPVPFLTVASGQPFRFTLASPDAEALRDAEAWLRDALTQLGAGSKTSAGYGYFEDEARPVERPASRDLNERRDPNVRERASLDGQTGGGGGTKTASAPVETAETEIIRKEAEEQAKTPPRREVTLRKGMYVRARIVRSQKRGVRAHLAATDHDTAKDVAI
jgi:CRISPR type III-B/RAMP module RAMP protein Cmr6